MKLWNYTDDIHNSVEIDGVKFRLNTAYDNIFRLIKYMNENRTDKLETFYRIIFFPKDHVRFQELTKSWGTDEYTSLTNFIMNEYIISDGDGGKKLTDVYKDSELIFASFYYDYGISLIEKKGKMTWKEFLILYSNLSPDSPLGRIITMSTTKDEELTPDGKKEKRKRLRMLNEDNNLNSQIDSLAKFLKVTARDKNVRK